MTNDAKNEWMLSIHGHWADKILSGQKTVELRRQLLQFRPGDRLWLYVTSPVAAVTGWVMVESVVTDDPFALWDKFGAASCVPAEVFFRYFNARSRGHAILVRDPVRLPRVVPLHAITTVSSRFHVPQFAASMRPWSRILRVLLDAAEGS